MHRTLAVVLAATAVLQVVPALACPVSPNDGVSTTGGAELPFLMLAIVAGGLGAVTLAQFVWRRWAGRPSNRGESHEPLAQ